MMEYDGVGSEHPGFGFRVASVSITFVVDDDQEDHKERWNQDEDCTT
jgi:hypothetical protein